MVYSSFITTDKIADMIEKIISEHERKSLDCGSAVESGVTCLMFQRNEENQIIYFV